MKKMVLFICVLFAVSCAGEPPVEPVFCDHDVECAEYPTWQTAWTYDEGYSNYECEPCWYIYRLSQKGECCACNPETHHTWCDEDRAGIYHCSPMGHFDHESCAGYCQRMLGPSAWYTNDDVCVGETGSATCDCGE